MLIGIDASRATAARRTGTEHYSLQIIRGLIAAGPEHRFRLYLREQAAPGLFPKGDNVESAVLTPRRLWTHLGLAREMRRCPPDMLFVPAHVVPLCHPPATVVTIHDIGYRFFPAQHPLGARLYLEASTRYSCMAARHVIADSQATARDLTQVYGVPAAKISVVYLGIDQASWHAEVTEQKRVRARNRLEHPYVLYIGTLQPRKNLARLIEAFAQLPAHLGEHDLVLAGATGWLTSGIFQRVQKLGLTERVRFLGYVAQEDLAALLSAASCFVLPSLYEGFGLPVLEAMACGTPVVCSNAGALPEVAGDAALLFSPTDTAALVAALTQVLGDAATRATLVDRGRCQVQRFSWERCARETLAVLEEVALP